MWGIRHQTGTLTHLLAPCAVLVATACILLATPSASAITQIPTPSPSANSFGFEAEKPQPPPTTTATISTPNNGANYSSNPVTVSGLCTTGLLVEVYDNGTLVGSVNCTSGSFSIQVTLFTGQNNITTYQYDDLNQSSPVGNQITLNYNNASFTAFGILITLTSNYARMDADPGDTLTWPLLLSGGTGPYAFSINWGDGSSPELMSQANSGVVNISHVYNQSGIYTVTVKVTDVNGVSAFLQLVAVANGKPVSTGAGSGSSNAKGGTPATVTKSELWPTAVSVGLFVPAFWLGRRSELVSLHRKLERDMQKYNQG